MNILGSRQIDAARRGTTLSCHVNSHFLTQQGDFLEGEPSLLCRFVCKGWGCQMGWEQLGGEREGVRIRIQKFLIYRQTFYGDAGHDSPSPPCPPSLLSCACVLHILPHSPPSPSPYHHILGLVFVSRAGW